MRCATSFHRIASRGSKVHHLRRFLVQPSSPPCSPVHERFRFMSSPIPHASSVPDPLSLGRTLLPSHPTRLTSCIPVTRRLFYSCRALPNLRQPAFLSRTGQTLIANQSTCAGDYTLSVCVRLVGGPLSYEVTLTGVFSASLTLSGNPEVYVWIIAPTHLGPLHRSHRLYVWLQPFRNHHTTITCREHFAFYEPRPRLPCDDPKLMIDVNAKPGHIYIESIGAAAMSNIASQPRASPSSLQGHRDTDLDDSQEPVQFDYFIPSTAEESYLHHNHNLAHPMSDANKGIPQPCHNITREVGINVIQDH
jgi:hypothetical protein